jgi:hypothetical protein
MSANFGTQAVGDQLGPQANPEHGEICLNGRFQPANFIFKKWVLIQFRNILGPAVYDSTIYVRGNFGKQVTLKWANQFQVKPHFSEIDGCQVIPGIVVVVDEYDFPAHCRCGCMLLAVLDYPR